MTPAAPLVGAVTTRPPAAFSSLTAIANRFTQSMTRSGSADSGSAVSRRYSSGARRGTFSRPGRMPAPAHPLATHCRITAQISRSLARTCSADRRLVSLASITPLTGRPDSVHRSSSSAADANG